MLPMNVIIHTGNFDYRPHVTSQTSPLRVLSAYIAMVRGSLDLALNDPEEITDCLALLE